MENTSLLAQAMALATKVGHVFIATANPAGRPHLAVAGQVGLTADGRVAVAAWFCLDTLTNLQHNPRLALVVWDDVTDAGFQLTGQVEQISPVGFLDGYLPAEAQAPPVPQVKNKLVVRVEAVQAFGRSPHRRPQPGADL